MRYTHAGVTQESQYTKKLNFTSSNVKYEGLLLLLVAVDSGGGGGGGGGVVVWWQW